MDTNRRPENMERITNAALANAFIDEQVEAIRAQVGDKKVLLALSGGVDSSVVAALLIKAIGKQLICVHVNHGLMRKGESEAVVDIFGKTLDANLIYIDATDRFLDLLAGVSDPERKRKIIGKEFIEVFADEARKLDDVTFLAQGTIYPDILESIKQAEGKKAVKSHHNVGGLPENMKDPLWKPDFGPDHPHPTAGATAVCARGIMVPLNVNLNTTDVSIAKDIAKRIRFSSGGFRNVMAIGVDMPNRNMVQVSMDLLDYKKTSVVTVLEAIKAIAATYGVTVHSVQTGVVPMEVILSIAQDYLHLEYLDDTPFTAEKIFESYLI